MTKYVLVNWPEIQDYMDNPRWNECYYGNSTNDDNEEGVWFVPEDLYNESIKFDPTSFDTPLGHICFKNNEVILNGVKYTTDGLQKGSEVILHNPNKGFWITTCTSYCEGFPPIFEDNSTLIESEIVGIRNVK